MFKPRVLKIASYVALVCCSLGVLLVLLDAKTFSNWRLYLTIISWGLLIYSSYLGTKLSTYELYEEDIKKLGLYIYGILVLFFLFLFTTWGIGILPALFLAITLHNQKKGLDDWIKESNER